MCFSFVCWLDLQRGNWIASVWKPCVWESGCSILCVRGVYAITAMPTLPSTQSPEMHSTHERMHTRVCTHRNRCWPLRTLAYVVHVAVRLQVIRRVCLCVSWNRCATLRVCAACVCLRERSKCLWCDMRAYVYPKLCLIRLWSDEVWMRNAIFGVVCWCKAIELMGAGGDVNVSDNVAEYIDL